MIDVSTLGKLLVEGPDAAAFLERLYPNRFADLASGRIRYGVLTTDAGRIMDDGTIARLARRALLRDDDLDRRRRGLRVVRVVERGLGLRRRDRERHRRARRGQPRRAAGARGARRADRTRRLERGVPRTSTRGSCRSRASRASCSGSASSASSATSSTARARTRRAPLGRDRSSGARVPFGLEPQRILRLEKAHIIVGQDTDSESNVLSAGMPWIVKLDKDDFVGRSRPSTCRSAACASGSSASRCRPGRCRRRVRRSSSTAAPAGRVTSARGSERLGRDDRPRLGRPGARRGGRRDRDPRRRPLERATVTLAPFYDPEGERLRS